MCTRTDSETHTFCVWSRCSYIKMSVHKSVRPLFCLLLCFCFLCSYCFCRSLLIMPDSLVKRDQGFVFFVQFFFLGLSLCYYSRFYVFLTKFIFFKPRTMFINVFCSSNILTLFFCLFLLLFMFLYQFVPMFLSSYVFCCIFYYFVGSWSSSFHIALALKEMIIIHSNLYYL